MRSSATISALAAAAAAVGIAVTGCGSGADSGDTSAQTSAESTAATSEAGTETGTETSAAAPADGQTVGEYLTANGVTQTIVKAGEQGVPTVDLPMPDGWEPITEAADVPPDVYGAIYLSAAKGTPNPPAILVRMARLEGGTFDVAKIMELAPNAVTKLPGWDGPTTGTPSELGGFQASQIAGQADVEGTPNFIARKTVVIPAPEHTYLLALDAQGPLDQRQALIAAMNVIDEGTTITP
ncbi:MULTISPECIES: LpqN/LpqT family lipoprotein [Mycolicibacterium]|uniref:LpqN n=1 Tax=Mycolicibacterium vanbaalenii (strain DSM 7251 / JCM 13017 / BCRC 16820 / KCTC 9966 / NRRL B-24157 / PYR-1) TaxID=350058 RepID=A1T4V0_MYCVP|nr:MULTISPECIES: LpqN/LpqT family lipoprotein [Mycolicibacterium]ABM12200.1 LpqN [Mycolicibacterium vanbaalenii PYR-1]MCV7127251.1 LpqN/LpqT family lipoprotein [Mycolicibacterium vanbaalenii PYR-1]QZY47476.1 LpqN/LpqT family lipoprotein [Mycolicibacterium austroafricanum]